MTYTPKTEAFEHQRKELAEHWSDPGRAWFWEQGTGKTKEFIDNAGMLADAREITGDFLLAPNGLHRNYVTREIPKHQAIDGARHFFWRSDRAQTKTFQNAARSFLEYGGHTSFGMSYDGLKTDLGKAFAKEYLTRKRCLYGADEAHRIINPDSDRGALALKSAPFAPYRRVMTGTPSAGKPWDVYSPIKFVDETFWARRGIGNFKAMQTTFGKWGKVEVRVARTGKRRWGVRIAEDGSEWRTIPHLEGFRDLTMLNGWIRDIQSRVLKEDVFDLPPKIYTRMEFELSQAQKNAYKELRQLGFALVGDQVATVGMAMTLLLRLQQISCGYLPTDPVLGEEAQPQYVFDENPRLELLREIVRGLDHQFLIWTRFNKDIELISAMLAEEGITFGRYDGQISDDECWANEDRFHKGDAQAFLLNTTKGSEGLTLTEARTAVYYNNSFKLIERLQSEDRPHRFGQVNTVNNIDLCGVGTIDDKIVDNLQGKLDVASTVLGDKLRDWIGTSQFSLDLS